MKTGDHLDLDLDSRKILQLMCEDSDLTVSVVDILLQLVSSVILLWCINCRRYECWGMVSWMWMMKWEERERKLSWPTLSCNSVTRLGLFWATNDLSHSRTRSNFKGPSENRVTAVTTAHIADQTLALCCTLVVRVWPLCRCPPSDLPNKGQ